MTDAASPEPTSRRRLLIILAVIAIVVIALFAGLFLYASSAAGSKASDYDDDYAAWKAKEKPVLLAATAKLPTGTYLSTDDVTSAKALATQKKGCDAVAASRKKVEAAADSLPTVGGNGLLGKVSSDYKDAGDISDRRGTTVQAYVKAASKTLAQVEQDCRWNIAYNAAASQPHKLWEKSRKYALKPGDREPGGILCAPVHKTACVSSIAEKKNTYADLRIKATKLYLARNSKFFSTKACGATSYGAACGVMRNVFVGNNKLELKNYHYIRTMKSSVNNAKLRANNKALDKYYERNEPKIRKAVLALDPALKKDKKARESPSWTDYVLARFDKVMLADLKDERVALAKL